MLWIISVYTGYFYLNGSENFFNSSTNGDKVELDVSPLLLSNAWPQVQNDDTV